MKKPPLKIARAVIYVCLQMLMRQVAHIPLLDNQHVDWGHIPFLHIWMSHIMKSLYCLLIVLSRTVAFTSAFLLYFISLIIVALLEFTQQIYSIQENLGPLIVNLRLASSSPTLATNLQSKRILPQVVELL